MSTAITVRAPAKINLHLGVGAPREDGFHPLATVYQAIGLYDDLEVVAAPGWRVEMEVADHVSAEALPTRSGDNIIDRAARLLVELHGVEVHGHVHVRKEIPIAGGLAGGSADAAAALVALDRFWDLGTSDDDLLRLAADLGSDVPFSLIGGTALGTGRGEIVESVPDTGTWWWVVVPSSEGMSTPAVYRHFDELSPEAPAEPSSAGDVLEALACGDVERLAEVMRNDLEMAACDLRPELAELIVNGEEAGALRGMVTGSGPTVVFLCEDGPHAREVAGALRDQGTLVTLVVNGPVAGAHLVETL